MRTFLSFFLVLGGFLVLSSCEEYSYDPPVIEGEVSFVNDVTPPLNNDCSKCHNVFKSQTNFYKNLAEKAFIDTVNPSSSKIYNVLKTNSSHQSYTSPDNLAKILKWFEQGAKNN